MRVSYMVWVIFVQKILRTWTPNEKISWDAEVRLVE